MKLYALIGPNNSVTGIVQVEQDIQVQAIASVYPQMIEITDMQPTPQIGWTFDGVSIVGTSISKKISKLAMLQRFTIPERLAILNYVGENPISIPAVLLQNIMAATFVDLSRADTQGGIGALAQLGLIASGRVSEILNSPVLPIEIYTS